MSLQVCAPKTRRRSIRSEQQSLLEPIEIDIAVQSSVQTAVESLTNEVGTKGLFALVNNAGIALGGPIETIHLDDWQRQFDVNLFGTAALTQAVIPLLRAATNSRIVNLGSILGLCASPFLAPYSASKFALEAFTDCLRIELAPWGIHTSVIQAGNVRTPIWDKAEQQTEEFNQRLSDEYMQMYGQQIEAMADVGISKGRGGVTPQKVARVIARALTSKRPRRHYRVGRDAKAFAIAKKFMPTRVFEYLLMRRFRLLS